MALINKQPASDKGLKEFTDAKITSTWAAKINLKKENLLVKIKTRQTTLKSTLIEQV